MTSSPESQTEATWQVVIRLLRWHKPAGRLILMIPALWAVVLASRGAPPLLLVVIIVLGSLATSAAGCVVNDLWDRNIDNQVKRTRNRPLASRTLSVQVAVIVLLVALLCAAGLALYLNPLSFGFCVAAVPFILLYPSAKRVFPIPQLVLSIAWGFAVLISWTAVTGGLRLEAWLLWGAVLTWTLGFDTVYAMADREDDRRIGIQSSALLFGNRASEAVGTCYLITVILLAGMAYASELSASFWLTLVLATGLWGWQYWRLRKPMSRGQYGKLFTENVLIGFVLLVGMITGSLFS